MKPVLALLASLPLLTLSSLPITLAAERPNVLLIITDDQGYGDFSLHGNPIVQTPVFDQFARQGIQFDRFFVSPVCAPTRASLLTGRWWLRTGVWGVTQSKENMRPEEVTVAEALKPGGYRTGYFGKWHNGEQFPYTPPGQGFDEFLGFNNGHWNHYFDTELIRGSQWVKTKGFMIDALTEAAIQFMEQAKGPFFCYVSFNTPHSPFQVPDRYFDKYQAKGLDTVLASVYGMCENIDDNFGRLLAALDRLKKRDNTIVLFTTDNGANTDRFNAGMRGRKGSVHEGGTRVPLVLQWPAKFQQPRIVREIAAHIDLYPTLLELCGVTPPNGPPIDGRSLVPLLEGRRTDWPDRMLFTQQSGGAPQPQFGRGGVRTQRYRAVLEGRGSAAENPAPLEAWQLYDLENDPGQSKDIAKDQPVLTKQLAAAYENWWKEVTAAGFEKPAIPVGYAEHDPVRLYAPQASFTGGIRFFAGPGYAHDWLTHWADASDRITFELDVQRAGIYEAELAYACPTDDAGSRIRLTAGQSSAEAIVTSAPAERLSLPHRDGGRDTYINRAWGKLQAGRLRLERGRQTLTIQGVNMTGKQILELKHVELRAIRHEAAR